MGLIRTVAIIVLSISFVVFVALFGRLPAFKNTPIGWLHETLVVRLPRGVLALDRVLTGGRLTSSLKRSGNYLMNEPHSIVMGFFISLQVAGEVLFIPAAARFLKLHSIHVFAIPIAVALPYICLYYCHTTSSKVSHHSHQTAVAAYPYDYILYHPQMECKTCRFPKPARSKHCSICKSCVQKQDHHCVWINNCVGRNNVIWFMALLLCTACLLLYASILGHGILDKLLQDKFVPAELIRGSKTSKRWSTKLDWWQYLDAWGYAIGLQPRIGGVTLLTIMCFPLASAFLLYHTYLLWAGMTTNETAKWADLREDILDGIVWKARMQDMLQDYPSQANGSTNPGLRDWKKSADWWIIRTKNGQQPTRWAQEANGQQEIDDRWSRVRNMRKEIDNVYDLGFWDNVKEMCFHRG